MAALPRCPHDRLATRHADLIADAVSLPGHAQRSCDSRGVEVRGVAQLPAPRACKSFPLTRLILPEVVASRLPRPLSPARKRGERMSQVHFGTTSGTRSGTIPSACVLADKRSLANSYSF